MNTHHNTPDILRKARAEADRERARADAGEGLARLRAASLDELADLSEEVRCQVDDLTDDAHSSRPMPPQGLRNVTARLSRLADTLSRAARGYAGARATDMAYPRIFEDLTEHGWTALPDRDLDGTLPPVPISELGDRRGYRRGWRRGFQTITLWFTGPYSLAYGAASGHGRLFTTQEVKAVITSAPTPKDVVSDAIAEAGTAAAVPFDATYDQVAEHMRAAGWGDPVDEHPCDARGICRPNGTGTSGAWESPSALGFRVYAWGIGDEPAHVWYWAAPSRISLPSASSPTTTNDSTAIGACLARRVFLSFSDLRVRRAYCCSLDETGIPRGGGTMSEANTDVPRLADYDVILVNSSAGKDSQAMLDEVCVRAEQAAVLDRVTVLHCALGHVEWPATAALARRQAEHYGVRYEERHRERGLLLDQVRQRGRWPSSAARYCTSDQKRGPARKLITQLVTELGPLHRPARVLNCMGLRAEESRARLKKVRLTRDEAATSGKRIVDTWLPIHEWTETEVWQRIHASDVQYHPSYDEGMTRLSCSLCVLASRADLIRAAQLRPELAAEYAELEAEIGHKFRNDLSMTDIIAAAHAESGQTSARYANDRPVRRAA